MNLREQLQTRVRNRHRERFWRDRDREKHTCAGCGRGYADAGFRWEVHHRDGDWLNGHPLNLVGICHRCHVAIHRAERVAADVADWRERFGGLDEGLSDAVWRGMRASRKRAEHPDCAHRGCALEASTTVTNARYGERYVCGAHVIAAASVADPADFGDSEASA